MSKNDGGPVYPGQAPVFKLDYNGKYVTDGSGHPEVSHYTQTSGMSMRDWFAGMALQGILASEDPETCTNSRRGTASSAYEYADAMLAEREKQ